MDSEQRSQSLMEKMADSWYNLRYILTNFFNTSENSLSNSETAVYILGRKFQIKRNNVDSEVEAIKSFVKSTIWFTYRKNFPPLLDSNFVSDTGWGCMIRAGQMVLAQVIKQHLKNHGDSRDKDLSNIAQAFADDDEQEHNQLIKMLNSNSTQKLLCPFSIQNIAILGNMEFNIKPGEWYKPNYILFILETLHNRFPIRGSEKLKMIVFNDSSIFLDQIVQKMFNFDLQCQKHNQNKEPENTKVQTKLVCETCLEENISSACSLAVFVLTRIGLEEPNPDYLRVIDDLMELKSFQGIVGGSPSKALYILGKVGQQYIYLDPHYVQLATTRKSIILDDTSFSCQNLHLMNSKDVDTSMGLSFYLRNYEELEAFWLELQNVRNRHADHFFIYKAEQTPDFNNCLNEIFPMDSSIDKCRENEDFIILK